MTWKLLEIPEARHHLVNETEEIRQQMWRFLRRSPVSASLVDHGSFHGAGLWVYAADNGVREGRRRAARSLATRIDSMQRARGQRSL